MLIRFDTMNERDGHIQTARHRITAKAAFALHRAAKTICMQTMIVLYLQIS